MFRSGDTIKCVGFVELAAELLLVQHRQIRLALEDFTGGLIDSETGRPFHTLQKSELINRLLQAFEKGTGAFEFVPSIAPGCRPFFQKVIDGMIGQMWTTTASRGIMDKAHATLVWFLQGNHWIIGFQDYHHTDIRSIAIACEVCVSSFFCVVGSLQCDLDCQTCVCREMMMSS